MWEAILSNRRRSRLLIGTMGAVLVILGFMIGAVADPDVGGPIGAVIALVYWLLLLCIALTGGGQALLLGARARPIGKEDAPQLWNVVEEMTIASGLGKMPQIYVIDEEVPNALAAGSTQERAVIAVTSGLLKRLSRDELQGVVAHEIGHVKNLDVRFMTIAVVMLASITIISDLFLRSLWFGAGRRRPSKIDPRAQGVILAVTVVLAIVAPLLARLLYMACSRQREYLADASAARFTRYPEGLASALEKIAAAAPSMKGVNRAIAPLYIVNPLQAVEGGAMLSTHPPTSQRVRILRAMAGGAGWVDYDKAFRSVRGAAESCIGKRTLSSEGSVPLREATPEGRTKSEMVERIREVDALLGRLADLITIPCACGVQIRVPNNLERDTFPCPRCGREHPMPRAGEPGAAHSAAASPSPRRLRYERKTPGWEAFKCGCGKAIQLSPAFDARIVRCHGCGREIEIADGKRVPAGAP